MNGSSNLFWGQVTTERSVTLSILLVRRLFLPAQTITAPDLPPQPALRFCQTVRLYTNKEYNPHFNFNEKQLILFGEVIQFPEVVGFVHDKYRLDIQLRLLIKLLEQYFLDFER